METAFSLGGTSGLKDMIIQSGVQTSVNVREDEVRPASVGQMDCGAGRLVGDGEP